jgi:hypothetical protein
LASQASDTTLTSVGIASITALHLLLKAAQAVGVRLHIETIIFHTTELSEEAEMVFNDAL